MFGEASAGDIKWLPGPVSWFGSGAVNGSKRYLLAYGGWMTSVTICRGGRSKTGHGATYPFLVFYWGVHAGRTET